MADAPPTTTTSDGTSNSNNNNNALRQYVAVRSAGALNDCIFLNLEAALPHLISNDEDDNDDSNGPQYKVFHTFVEAEQFITGDTTSSEQGPCAATTRRRATTSTPGSDTTPRKRVAQKNTQSAPANKKGSAASKRKAPPVAATTPAPRGRKRSNNNNQDLGVAAPTIAPEPDAAAAAETTTTTTQAVPDNEDEPTRVARLLLAASSSHYKPSEQWEQFYIKLAGLSVDGKLPERIDDEKLREFYYRQQEEYRKLLKGEHSALSVEKYEKLKKIGFEFGATPKRLVKVNKKKFDTQFETMIAKLQDFAHQNGHCNVLKSDLEHRDLWNWMLRIRADYKRLSVPEERDKCRLSTLQMQRLTELGFSFLTVAYKSWDERLEDLKAYQASGQDINKIPTLNHELGEFVGRCRKEYKHFLEGRRTAMTAERAQKLEAIGFDWNMHLHRDTATYPKPKSWEQRYEQLKEYYLQHGDTLVNKNYTDGLGRWVADQRKAFRAYASSKKSSLNPEKVGKLVEIGFIVDANVYKKKRQKVEEPAEPDPAPEMCWYI